MRPLVLMLSLVGCGGAGTPAPVASSGANASDPMLGAGVSPMEFACFEQERCDGLDSDCDGLIDEGCEGAEAGALQVGLAWSGRASLALELNPGGDAATPTDGRVLDGCDGLGPHLDHQTIEELTPGEYRVSVARGGECDANAPTTASITVVVEGRRLGTYNVVVERDTVEVVRFTVAR